MPMTARGGIPGPAGPAGPGGGGYTEEHVEVKSYSSVVVNDRLASFTPSIANGIVQCELTWHRYLDDFSGMGVVTMFVGFMVQAGAVVIAPFAPSHAQLAAFSGGASGFTSPTPYLATDGTDIYLLISTADATPRTSRARIRALYSSDIV
jgi:hypothetical protein